MRAPPAEQELHDHFETGEYGRFVVLEAVVDEADHDFAVFQCGVSAEYAHVIGDARIRTGAAQGLGHVFQQIRLDAVMAPCRGSGTAVRGALCGSGGDMLLKGEFPQRGADTDFGQSGDGGEFPFVERACGKLEGEQERSVRDTGGEGGHGADSLGGVLFFRRILISGRCSSRFLDE